MPEFCQAHSKRTHLPCRWPPVRGRRTCRWHGGTSGGARDNYDIRAMRVAVVAQQALFKRLGLPWYGGRPPKNRAKVLSKMGQALVVADTVIEGTVDDAGAVSLGGDHAQLLDQSSRDGLILQRDTVKRAHAALLASDGCDERGNPLPIDYKLLRLGNDAANALNRLAVRVAEGQFRVRRDDVLATLLEKLTKKENAP